MGGRGSFSGGGGGSVSEWFNEKDFKHEDDIDGAAVLRQTKDTSNKEPVYAGNSNCYIILDKDEDVPKNICYYKDHKLKYSIDFDYKGNNINVHQHAWESRPDPKGGNDIIFRKRHDKSNILPVSQKKLGLVRKIIKKYGLDERYRITIEGG
jgi:hypothetical protein|nr:MAG TPA: hypothetical protein [Caudoviricetes sp.]